MIAQNSFAQSDEDSEGLSISDIALPEYRLNTNIAGDYEQSLINALNQFNGSLPTTNAPSQGTGIQSFQTNGSPASLIASPSFPPPDTVTEIRLDDYSLNTVGAIIVWYVDGARIDALTGLRKITIVSPALGKTKEVRAELVMESGVKVSASYTFRPIRVDIIIDANTTAPVFYAGRSLPGVNSPISATAVVYTGTGIGSSDLSYVWKLENKVINGGNTRGGNTIRFSPPLRKEVTLVVEVSNLDGLRIGRKSIDVPLTEGELIFYENNALRGISEVALKSPFDLTANEITVLGAPYHLEKSSLASGASVSWTLGGRKVSGSLKNPYEITLRKDSGSAEYTVGLQIRSASDIISAARNSFQIRF